MCKAQSNDEYAVQLNTVNFHVENYIKKPHEKCCVKFRMQFPNVPVPSKSSMSES